jgi:hypothetical protein
MAVSFIGGGNHFELYSDVWQVGGFSLDTPVSSTNKTDRHHITEILLKMALNTITLTPLWVLWFPPPIKLTAMIYGN